MSTSILPVSNETENSITRTTNDHRQLTYELKVIQQPERARACGSGAKSSADRRPVDPPPVVELKVYEGDGEAKTDITFQHNANFFLFTTLENARPIAKGRGPATAPTFPVLTGSPVAGMAYLDRPSPAGYFIFPDLSVRHEGMYRLSFSLYEELKESKDADLSPPEGSPQTRDELLSSSSMAPRAHVHFRLEVKSVPFAVFSAKKFPGLSESTPLSRTVAEQGCRVRIRRDVRMRRRDKPTDGYQQGDYDDEPFARSERFATPQHLPDRPRSISNGSIDAHTPYSTGRRSSMDYFAQPGSYTPGAYQQPPPPPPPSQAANSYSNHLNFSTPSTTPTFPPPPPPPPPMLQHNVQGYIPHNTGYPYPSSTHSRQMSAPQNYRYQQPPPPPPPVPTYTNHTQTHCFAENTDYQPIAEHRRTSATVLNNQTQQTAVPQLLNQYVHNHPAIQQFQQSQQSYYGQQAQQSLRTATPHNLQSSPRGPPQLPPLRTDNIANKVAAEPKYEPASPSSSMSKPIVASPSYTSGYYDNYASTAHSDNSLSGSVGNGTMTNPLSTPMSAPTTKRQYGTVFDTTHMDLPIHNGMRPNSADQGRDRAMIATDEGDVEDSYNALEELKKNTLVYRRADGRQALKKCPTPTYGPNPHSYRRRQYQQ